MAAGGVFIASAYQLLRRGCTYDQLVTAVNTCVLPAGVKLIHIAEGSVTLKVQAEDISALDTLWSSYTDGTLRKSLQALFITDEMRELSDGEQLEVSVTIDYFRIPHNTLCLPPKFCITYCLKMLLGKCNTPRSI